MKIALAQINPIVGDLAGNLAKLQEFAGQARERGAQLVIFPELSLTGYPPEDLLFREGFVERAGQLVDELAASTSRTIDLLVGYPRRAIGRLYNAAAYCAGGRVQYVYDKQLLPNYGVFDEVRYFTAGSAPVLVDRHGVRFGITVCEDIWQPAPAMQLRAAGARLILNINASPYHTGKQYERLQTLRARHAEAGLPIIYVNLVGGQDELVFDGHSLAMDDRGTVTARAAGFREELLLVDSDTLSGGEALSEHDAGNDGGDDETADVYAALTLAIRDYVRKNGFAGVVIGLSGGVDSALVLALAVDALGAAQVEAVMMPSRYTSRMSLDDARRCAENFGVHYSEISIESAFNAMLASLQPQMVSDGEWKPDITQENIQARCRGIMLMAISNKRGRLVLTTGNKSEMSVGYATLYGDMAGGFAPLKDVSKQRVYRLCQFRNRAGEMIPQRILDRPPSAELAHDQKDADSLPEYPVLDAILELYLERELSQQSIVAQGFAPDVVRDVVRRVNRNEYKRRQAAPGVKITRRALGRERRYPITNGYE